MYLITSIEDHLFNDFWARIAVGFWVLLILAGIPSHVYQRNRKREREEKLAELRKKDAERLAKLSPEERAMELQRRELERQADELQRIREELENKNQYR